RGSWLNFQANGMDALRAIDAAGPVEKLGFPVDAMSFINGKGKSLGRIPMAAQRPDGQESQMMPRTDLYVALGKLALDHGGRVNYGNKPVDATPISGDGVQIRFADGTTAEGDLLVGCDGIHSQVRQILDSQAPAPRYVPVLNTGGYIPDFAVDVPAKEF